MDSLIENVMHHGDVQAYSLQRYVENLPQIKDDIVQSDLNISFRYAFEILCETAFAEEVP